MAPRVRTLADVSSSAGLNEYERPRTRTSGALHRSNAAAAAAALPNATSSSKSTHKLPTLHPLTDAKLPLRDACRQMLERVAAEFAPLIQSRGYNVRTISECCCCGDGLDELNNRKKKKKTAENILGYNQTIFRSKTNKYHEIHIRLRHPRQHDRLYPYEDVAGTLAHELAHCERGPHDATFFRILDGILDEHATLMAGSHSTGTSFPSTTTGTAAFTGSGQVLGGGGTKQSRLLSGVGKRLGGDGTFQRCLNPREAAFAAAQGRLTKRLSVTQCCQPCVIDLSKDGSEGDENRDENDAISNDLAKRKFVPASALSNGTKRKNVECIDLTVEERDEEDSKPPSPSSEPGHSSQWPCAQCTFLNSRFLEVCELCSLPKNV